MSRPRSLQEWVSLAGGARLQGVLVVLGLVLFSAVYTYKQFRGPANEVTCARLEVAKSVAEGRGLATRVMTPQLQTIASERGWSPDASGFSPSLDQAPLFPLLAGLSLHLAGETKTTVPAPPQGLRNDYVVLGLNLLGLSVGLWLTWRLGTRLFGRAVGVWAVVGVVCSPLVWKGVLGLEPTSLLLALFLAFAMVLEAQLAAPGRRRAAALGGVAAAAAATHYAALCLLPVALAAAVAGGPSRQRLARALSTLAAFAALTGAWWYRNIHYTGNPFGTAWQLVASRDGDSTALPETPASRFSSAGHVFDLAKWSNKVSSELRLDLVQHLWTGALIFGALFVVGLLYRFRDARALRLRLWLCAVSLLWLFASAALGPGNDGGSAMAPLVPFFCLFGAAFLHILLHSLDYDPLRRRAALAIVLGLQFFPMLRGLAEPRRLHFSYPPYYPKLFVNVSETLGRPGLEKWTWMSDVPAGAAWYGGTKVWLLPSSPGDFYRVQALEPVAALVLSPSFFSKAVAADGAGERDRAWQDLRLAVASGHVPASWPLSRIEKVAPDLMVLVNPAAAGVEK